MTPEEQKRRGLSDEERIRFEEEKYARKAREQREAMKREAEKKESGGFFDKAIYKILNPSSKPIYQSSNSSSDDPLKRDLSYAERLARGFTGASR